MNPIMLWNVCLLGVRSDGDMASSLTGDWFQSQQRVSSHRLAWTDAPVGAFVVDLSLDGVTVDATLTASEFYPPLEAPAGSAGDHAFEVDSALPYRRVRYLRTSGTGTLTGKINYHVVT